MAPRTLTGRSVTLEPVRPDHVEALRRILGTDAVRARWGDEARSGEWPFDDDFAVRFAVLEGGAVVGMVQYGEEDEPTIRCYAAVGFRPVGLMRRYERDPHSGEWHDGLLMDLLAGELQMPA